jgi:hypothetical protein
MVWNFIPAKGSDGGILVDFRNSTIEILECHGFEFSAVAVVKNKHDNLVWRLSYPILQAKSSTHRMCAQDHLFNTHTNIKCSQIAKYHE